jgi:NodT family efflux transporter outer membrane factor (OMF) lipoprotein
MPAAFHQAQVAGNAADGPWWTSFEDPQLSDLVKQAVASNHDVRLALQRVKQARANETISDSALFPTISAGGSHINSKNGFSDSVKQQVPDIRSTSYGLNLNWEIDVFGSNRAAARAANQDAAATVYEAAGARLLTAGEVARYYFIWRAAQDKLAALEQLLNVQRQAQLHHERRRDEGLESLSSTDEARAQTARIAAQLAPVRTQTVAAEQHLATLLGTRDLSVLQAGSHTSNWGNVPTIAAGQPGELLWRRPDLLAAESRLRAEGERVESARTQRWPKFFLSALLGRQSLGLNGIMNGPARLTNVAAAFAIPIFDAGRINADIERQSSIKEGAWLSYDQAALRALEEVETSLARLHNEQDDISRANEQLAIREINFDRASTMLREGEIDQLSWLSRQQALLQSRLNAIDAREACAVAAVQLYQALGGGWQANDAAQATSAQPIH